MVDELIGALVPRLAEHPGRVRTVVVRKGELRILSDHALANAFEILARGTRLEGADLVLETVATVVSCTTCGYHGPAGRFGGEDDHFSIPVLSCPQCGADVHVDAGRELYVDHVTLSDDSPADG
ncbi:MAG: hydrogenase maturation nickel metallochaperone HypA [Thermotogota bacterium]